MWRVAGVSLAAVLLGACATERKAAPAMLVGVWQVTELASRVPGGNWEPRGAPAHSQFIFTREHYSYLYVPRSAPRKKFAGDPNKPTAAEKVEAYDSIVAATGRYTLSGGALTLTALLHKNPNEMAGEPLRYAVEVDGNRLTMVIVDPPFLPGREWRMTLVRVD
jgi:hypothetical protein